MNDLDSWIARLKAETAGVAPAAPGGAPAPNAGANAPANMVGGLLSHPLALPFAVGLIAYFAGDKDWKWGAAAAGAALVLRR